MFRSSVAKFATEVVAPRVHEMDEKELLDKVCYIYACV